MAVSFFIKLDLQHGNFARDYKTFIKINVILKIVSLGQKQRLAMLLELGLELLSSSIPRCLILQSAEITGVNHHAWRKTRREKSKPNRRESFKKEVVANTKISYDIQEEKKGNTITTFNKDQGQLPLARAQPRATPG
ncbi:uncharacterized protein [Symphalangus syndactylus]|uniref:uncharacterized protein isoform X3 n=1 Tax=Symphalangus syndactylus TaxID=9590 RepID=UPI003004FDD5